MILWRANFLQRSRWAYRGFDNLECQQPSAVKVGAEKDGDFGCDSLEKDYEDAVYDIYIYIYT